MIYLAVLPHVVSSVIVREEEGKQTLIFYLSKTIAGQELRYSEMEKLALALIISARKLRPYFDSSCNPVPVKECAAMA